MTLEIFPFLQNTNLWSSYAHEPAVGPCSEPEESNPNLHFCKIRGIIICDNAMLIKFIKISFKTSVSIRRKHRAYITKSTKLPLHEEVRDVYFEGDKHINTLYGKDAEQPKLKSAQIRDNQSEWDTYIQVVLGLRRGSVPGGTRKKFGVE